MNKFIVVVVDLGKGFKFRGPFDTQSAAYEFARNSNIRHLNWTIVELEPVK